MLISACITDLNFFQYWCLLLISHHIESGLNCLGVFFDRQRRIVVFISNNPAFSLSYDLSLRKKIELAPRFNHRQHFLFLKKKAHLISVLPCSQPISPVAEGTFCKLHNVTLVHQCHAFSSVDEGIVNGGFHDALSSFLRNGLDSIRCRVGEPDLVEPARDLRPKSEF